MSAVNAEQRLQPLEQDILHSGHHLPLYSHAVHLLQQGHDADALQAGEAILPHRPSSKR